MPNIGFPELIVILLIVLVVFGARRLPQIGEGIGKAIRNLKRGLQSEDDIEVSRRLEAQTPEAQQAEASRTAVREAEVVDRKS
ncbi:MAG: twin-arginine translocase TatA/TatE family subunit [Myxococcales bacterium]|nr:twin-arginine translocase TatA/TatE family subunit [Myxococcales bacterium]